MNSSPVVKTVITDKIVDGRRVIYDYIVPEKPVSIMDLGAILLKLAKAAQGEEKGA